MEKETIPTVKIGSKTLYTLFVLILFIVLFATLSSNKSDGVSQASVNSASVLYAMEKTFDFGTISMQNGKVSHKFEMRNDGAEAVTIEKVYTSCMCTEAFITDASGKKYGGFGMPGHGDSSKESIEVKSGETATVEAIYDPNAHGPSGVGLAQRSIYLETNSSQSPKLELSFQVMVIK